MRLAYADNRNAEAPEEPPSEYEKLLAAGHQVLHLMPRQTDMKVDGQPPSHGDFLWEVTHRTWPENHPDWHHPHKIKLIAAKEIIAGCDALVVGNHLNYGRLQHGVTAHSIAHMTMAADLGRPVLLAGDWPTVQTNADPVLWGAEHSPDTLEGDLQMATRRLADRALNGDFSHITEVIEAHNAKEGADK